MRFPVDANLSPGVAARLRLEGHDVEHVGDIGLLMAEDGPILAHAASALMRSELALKPDRKSSASLHRGGRGFDPLTAPQARVPQRR